MDLFLFLALWCRGGPTLFSVGIMIAFKGLVASVRLLRCPEHPPPPLYQMSRLPLSYLTSQCTLPYIGCCQGKVGCGCVGVGKQEVSGGGPEEGCSLLNVETRGCRICRRSSDHLPAETRSRNKLFSCASLNLMLNLKNPQ